MGLQEQRVEALILDKYFLAEMSFIEANTAKIVRFRQRRIIFPGIYIYS